MSKKLNKFERIAENGGLVKAERTNTDGSSSQKEIKRFGEEKIVPPPYPFNKLVELYELNNTAKRCVDLIAKTVIKAGYVIGTESENPDQTQYNEIRKWFATCNPESTFENLVQEMIIDRKTAGSAGIEVARGLDKKPLKLYNIPIETVRVMKGNTDKGFKTGQRFVQNETWNESNSVKFNRYYPNPEDRTKANGYDPKLHDIMWFTEPNPRSRFYGQSPFVTLIESIVSTKYCSDYNQVQFENGFLNKYVLLCDGGNVKADSVEGLEEFLSSVSGVNNSNKIPIINSKGINTKTSLQKVSSEIKDGSFIELLKFNREEVYSGFGVPPILLNINENSTQANQEAQLQVFYEEIISLQREIAYRFTRLLQEDLGYPDFYFEFNAPDPGDLAKMSGIFTTGIEDGTFSINEKREALGYTPLESKGANEHLVHTNFGLIPVEDLIKLSTEEYSTKVGEEQGKAIVSSLLNLRNKVVEKKQKDKISKGTDDKDNSEPYPKV